MSVRDWRPADVEVGATEVQSAVVAAILGSVAFGIVMSLTLGDVMFTAIPAMYGLAGVDEVLGVFVAWGIHLSHGVALGLAYGAAVTVKPRYGRDLRAGLLAGSVYGVILWLVLASVVMPLWVGLASSMSPPVPSWEPMSLLGHVFYGLYVGGFVPLFRRY